MTEPNSQYRPEDDGHTHINIYSAGKTPLGRVLSNFSRIPIHSADGPLCSIEGYWYWLRTPGHPSRDDLRSLHGLEAKSWTKRHLPGLSASVGRKMVTQLGQSAVDSGTQEFRDAIRAALLLKLEALHLPLQRNFESSTLPFAHYYVFAVLDRAAPTGPVRKNGKHVLVRQAGHPWLLAFFTEAGWPGRCRSSQDERARRQRATQTRGPGRSSQSLTSSA